MANVLADANNLGHVLLLLNRLVSGPLGDLWRECGFLLLMFADVHLIDSASDEEVWRTCQKSEAVLVTANRNRHGPLSLEEVIRKHNTPDSGTGRLYIP